MYWHRPLSRLETATSAVVVAVVLAFFLERLLYYMELAERTAMEVTVSHVNSGIAITLAHVILGGDQAKQAEVLRQNPFQLAKMAPANFWGDTNRPDLRTYERGGWIFDTSRSELVYLPRLRRGLKTTEAEEALRFHLSGPVNGVFYRLVPASKYTWD
jgi:hypothetical protein